MNLVKLYTHNQTMFIDTAKLNGRQQLLTIYTSRGNRKCDLVKTRDARFATCFGVHRDNLFASPELAMENKERIIKQIFG